MDDQGTSSPRLAAAPEQLAGGRGHQQRALDPGERRYLLKLGLLCSEFRGLRPAGWGADGDRRADAHPRPLLSDSERPGSCRGEHRPLQYVGTWTSVALL
ncbi:hypothetical protein P7K49_023050 [Saguinus oedipus]|uniref:Uncharacterized protein n=1 Tax=Saguinus oedipus TaxID=9490 RepID=A0ABQ9ULC0_SAGOE|nr:hypothetical protein P7K49_023050 [Saguinus oedipus]